MTNSPLISQYISSPIVARAKVKDPLERKSMFESLGKSEKVSWPLAWRGASSLGSVWSGHGQTGWRCYCCSWGCRQRCSYCLVLLRRQRRHSPCRKPLPSAAHDMHPAFRCPAHNTSSCAPARLPCRCPAVRRVPAFPPHGVKHFPSPGPILAARRTPSTRTRCLAVAFLCMTCPSAHCLSALPSLSPALQPSARTKLSRAFRSIATARGVDVSGLKCVGRGAGCVEGRCLEQKPVTGPLAFSFATQRYLSSLLARMQPPHTVVLRAAVRAYAGPGPEPSARLHVSPCSFVEHR